MPVALVRSPTSVKTRPSAISAERAAGAPSARVVQRRTSGGRQVGVADVARPIWPQPLSDRASLTRPRRSEWRGRGLRRIPVATPAGGR